MKQRRISIVLPPVIDELAGGEGQNGRRQAFHTHPECLTQSLVLGVGFLQLLAQTLNFFGEFFDGPDCRWIPSVFVTLSIGSIHQTSVSETKSILDAIVSTVAGTESNLVVTKTVLETAESILDVTTTILNEAETMLDDTSSIVSGSKRTVFVARGSLSAEETVRFGTLTTLFVPSTRVFVASTTGFVTLSIVVVLLSIVGNAMQVQSFQ
jgi:hypothetical protein